MLDYMMGSAAYRLALVTFDSRPEQLWNFPTQHDGLQQAFLHPESGDNGAAIVDAVDYGIGLLEQQPSGSRRILLLISQPQDDGSSTKPEDVVRRLGQTNTTIYSITFSPEKTWLKDQFTKPRHENAPYAMPDHAPLLHTFDLGTPLFVALKAMREDTAAQVAALSGGEHLRFDNKADLERKLTALANDIPNSYTLTFRPTAATPGFHTLHLEVLHQTPTLTVTTRASYWLAPPPQVQ